MKTSIVGLNKLCVSFIPNAMNIFKTQITICKRKRTKTKKDSS